jgi:predicted RND superfamily exporter protein
LLGWFAVLLILTPGVLRLEISTSTDDVLDRSGPEWSFYQASIREFGGDEVIVVAFPSEQAFDPAVLGQIAELTRQLEAVPGVRRVDSLATVPLVRVDESGSLDLSAALAEGLPGDPAEREALRRLIRADRIAPETLISADERVVAINVQLDGTPKGGFDAAVSRVRQIVEPHGAWVSGVPVFRAEINRAAGLEIAKFVVLTVLIVGFLTFALVGSLPAVAVALGVGGVGTWVTLGALGTTATALTLITVILPSLMLALGCAYSMHLIVAARGAQSPAALESQLAAVFEPTAFSGLTTAIGFLAVGSVRIAAIEQLGGYGALGVLFVVAAVLTVVPAVLALRPLPGTAPRFEIWLRGDLAGWVFELARRRGGLMIVLWSAMAGLCAFGFTRVSVETDATRWFAPGSEVRGSYDRIREHLAGISPMNVVIRAGRGVVTEPETLKAIDGLTTYLNGLPEMGKAIAVTDPLRQLHGSFSGAADAPVPETSELVDQYLLFLESVEYLPDLLSSDRESANVALRLDDNGSESLLAVAALAEAWWARNGPGDTEARATGIMFEFARAEDEIAFGQLRGFSWALVVILGLMVAVYRTARLAALAMIPDVLPLVIVFGFLGLASIPMDAGIVVSGSLILGMAVDDTLHMVSAWQEHVRAGEDPEMALHSALRHVLAPVILTTIVIGLGFSVLVFADFAFVKNLGILVVVQMVVCLLGDVIFLPALLLRFGRPVRH